MDSQSEEVIKARFEDVCGELNLDERSKDNAWKAYLGINNDYVLEGDHIEWLACALYIACRSSSTQTVEGRDHSGNNISLTQILRATKVNLIEFFRKIKKWLEMAQLPPPYLERIEGLERKFEVISVIFKKYEEEFCEVFLFREGKVTPTTGSGRPRSRKPNRARPCTASELFKFGWTLYVHIKNQYPLISDDLVNSHYLLLCCVNMLYTAAILNKRTDLVNTTFPDIPEWFTLTDSSPPSEFSSMLPDLCRRFNAILRECQVVMDYFWWPSVKRMYQSSTLKGIQSTEPTLQDVFNNLLTATSFQANMRSLKSAYELAVLCEGDFDERMFLERELSGEIVATHKMRDMDRLQPGIIYQSPQHLQYGTPLTGKEYISTAELKLTPVSDANQSVTQLHLLLDGCHHEPSDSLQRICSCCSSSPLREIQLRIAAMSSVFLLAFKADSKASPDNFALVRLRLSQTLYYKLLTSIVTNEERRTMGGAEGHSDYSSLQAMLEHDHFHKSLFACCIEIVLFSYNSHSRIFPWVLENIIDISPFHFYKVIEIIIKTETSLPRGVVKHLCKIEESILSFQAWRSDSPLFDAIDGSGPVPFYEDVALPESASTITPTPSLNSPLHPRLKKLGAKETTAPSPLSVRDRYSTPSPSARRQLFSPNKSPSSSPTKHPQPIAPKPQGRVMATAITNLPSLLLLQQLLQQGGGTSAQKSEAAASSALSSDAITASTVQALLNLTSMTSPLKTSPEKSSAPPSTSPPTSTQATLPSITVTSSPISTPMEVTTPTNTPPTPKVVLTSPPKPKRNGSVALFYRKVYQMAYPRTKDLCERLSLTSSMIQKVWTCLEFAMMKSPDMMRDRHIDQLIMCSIYVLSKVMRQDITFQEIMRQYRHQPQAKSHVYRSVLLNNGRRVRSNSVPDLAGDSQPFGEKISNEEEEKETSDLEALLYRADIPVGSRGDIIQFYNKVFIGYIKDFVTRFSPVEDGRTPQLSPLPVIRRPTMSPRKLSKNHQIFVSPLKGNQPARSPLAKSYIIGRSPASELHELNQVVGGVRPGTGAKRQLDPLLCTSPAIISAKKPRANPTSPRPQTNLLMRQAISLQHSRGANHISNGNSNHDHADK